MLNQTSIESVVLLAKKIGDAGLSLTPKAATPLAMAVAECYTPNLDHTTDEGDVYWVAEEIAASSMRETQSGFPHDDAIETLSGMGAAAVQRTLNFARNEVNPKIKQVVDAVEKALASAEITAVNPVAIVPNYLGGVWSSSTLRTLAETYELIPAASVKLPSYFPAMDVAGVMETLKTGTSRFDAEIAEWAAILGAEWFMSVFNRVFLRDSNGDSFERNMDYVFDMVGGYPSQEEARNTLLAVFLMAANLKENPPEEAGIDLNTFRKALRDVVEQAGRLIMREFEKHATDVKSGTLLRAWPTYDTNTALQAGRVISVNGDVYTKWLNEGGSPEVLLGSYITDRNTGYAHLLANAERYKNEWARMQMIRRSRANSEKFNIALTVIGKEVSTLIASIVEDDLVVQSRAVFHERLRERMSQITINDMDNLYPMIRNIICYSMYAHTQAEDTLACMDQIMTQQPGIDVREAALYAVIDQVVDWLYELFQVTENPNRDAIDKKTSGGVALVTLANAVELGGNIVERVTGNDISNQTAEFKATVRELGPVIAVKLQSKLQPMLPA